MMMSEAAVTHPTPLLHQPGVQQLPDDLQDPADHHPDVLQMIGGEGLEKKQLNGSEQALCFCLTYTSNTMLGVLL